MEPVAANRELDSAADLDRLLRFSPAVAEHYERDHAPERGSDLRRNGLVGILFYNVYNITGLILTPDVVGPSLVVRLGLFTPVALLLVWLIGRVGAVQRERLMLVGMIGAIVSQIAMVWLTQAPLGSYAFAEVALAVIFGNIVLALRFPHAIVMTGVSALVVGAALATKPGLDGALRIALFIQFATACASSLYANHQMEARRCRDYLVGLRARLLREVAEQARQRFQDLSRTDALTGLPNRRALDLCLDRWLTDGAPIAIAMIDIDHFKRFNDTLGHLAGDACLRRVADTLAALTFARTDCLCARYGGEEFAVVLKGGGRREAARLAVDLVETVAALAIPHPNRGDRNGVVTVSVGLAVGGEVTDAASRSDRKAALLAAADRALYEAKRRGRNRAIIATPPPAALALAG